MSRYSIIQAYKDSLATATSRQVIVSAATPLELSKRDGFKNEVFAIKMGNSSAEVYEEDYRAVYERPTMDITCFVETSDSHTVRDIKYELMLKMADEVVDWILKINNSDIGVVYSKYMGVINTVDDQPGFYSQTIRIEYEQIL